MSSQSESSGAASPKPKSTRAAKKAAPKSASPLAAKRGRKPKAEKTSKAQVEIIEKTANLAQEQSIFGWIYSKFFGN